MENVYEYLSVVRNVRKEEKKKKKQGNFDEETLLIH